jgi:hypothetical protein
MKKLLLSVSFLLALTAANAQDLLMEDNFDALTVGNIGTDLTGTTPGQGDYLTYIAAGGDNSAFQIVADADPAHGNVLQVTGSATAANSRFLWKDGLGDMWAARTEGNDILEVEFEMFTGGATTSKNSSRIVVYDVSGAQALAGLSLAQDTKVISGVAYYDNAGTVGNYLFNLGTTPVVLPANTWIRMGMSFNYSTGDVYWRCEGYFDGFVTGAGAFTDPNELDVVMAAGTANTVAAVTKFDNLTSRASAEDTLANPVDLSQNIFSVYPNPANNVVNVANAGNIEAVNIVDINGRVVKKQTFAGETTVQLDITDLASGVYMMNITSEGSVTTKKIVKQ